MFRDKEPVPPIPEAAFLTTVTDNITIGLIEGILEENHIPFLKQSRGSGDYLQIVCGLLLSELTFSSGMNICNEQESY